MRAAWVEVLLIMAIAMGIHAWGFYDGVKAARCTEYQQGQVKKQ